MYDGLERLSSNPALIRLLDCYVQASAASPEVWRNRVDQLDGVEPKKLVRLHGELIAFGWIELNLGAVPTCYRSTAAGRRALKRSGAGRADQDYIAEAA
jgi:hypothetical protein